MITAVDSNILIDVFGPDPIFGPRSAAAIRTALARGRLVACEVVWAEVGASFASAAMAHASFQRLNLEFSPLTAEAPLEAGSAWKTYRSHGGRRTRVAADFLVGAHALSQADCLLTRDRGFYRSYFKRLTIVDPTAP